MASCSHCMNVVLGPSFGPAGSFGRPSNLKHVASHTAPSNVGAQFDISPPASEDGSNPAEPEAESRGKGLLLTHEAAQSETSETVPIQVSMDPKEGPPLPPPKSTLMLDSSELDAIREGAIYRQELAQDLAKTSLSCVEPAATQIVTKHCIQHSFLVREISVCQLLPEVRWVVLKMPSADLPEHQRELFRSKMETALPELLEAGLRIMFWSHASAAPPLLELDLLVRLNPSNVKKGTLTSRIAKERMVLVEDVDPGEVYMLVQRLQAEVGPVMYIGVEVVPLACAAVGVADGISATDVAKLCSNLISITFCSDALGQVPALKNEMVRLRDKPLQVYQSGNKPSPCSCCVITGISCCLCLYGCCCGCSFCPGSSVKQLAALSELYDSSSEDEMTKQVQAARRL